MPSRKGRKNISREEYKQIKSVLNIFPKGKQGIKQVYDGLNISSGTASVIRRSKDFEDYHRMLDEQRRKTEERKAIRAIEADKDFVGLVAADTPEASNISEEPVFADSTNVHYQLGLANGKLNVLMTKIDKIIAYLEADDQILTHDEKLTLKQRLLG